MGMLRLVEPNCFPSPLFIQNILQRLFDCPVGQLASFAMLILLGCAVSFPANADDTDDVDITITGTVTDGTDGTGVFGTPGDLSGKSFILEGTFNQAGSQSETMCGSVVCASYITGSGAAQLTINGGKPFTFGEENSKAQIYVPTAGNSYGLTAGDGALGAGSGLSGGVDPTTGNISNNGGLWYTSFINSSVTGSFSFEVSENMGLAASGDLAGATITVSGPYIPSLPTPAAASNQLPKNNGTNNSTDCSGGGNSSSVPTGTPSPNNLTDGSEAAAAERALPHIQTAAGLNVLVGNPINAATGNKVQVETDFSCASHMHIGMTRTYNSFDTTSLPFGTGWRGTYDRSVTLVDSGSASVTHQDGSVDNYISITGTWTPAKNVTDVLGQTSSGGTWTGWQLTRSDDSNEYYNTSGKLTSIVTRAGLTTTLTYMSGNLTTVTGPFGQTLTFTYDTSNRVLTMTVPDTGVFHYAYDANNNLSKVTYPGNAVRWYNYNVLKLPHLLTSITDELGKNYASFTYDSQGRATSSQHGAGADLTTITYNSGGTTTVTDANGNAHTNTLTTNFGLVQIASITGTPYHAAGGQAFTFDSNGFAASVTDFNGNVTTYIHNAKGEETQRIEAYGTTLARTISTTWLTTFHLPSQITEPNRVTNFTYDTSGNMLTKTITAGTKTREWIYTYNTHGQVLTAKDPNSNVTTLTYDTHGNIATSTDALSHETQFTGYNADGFLTDMLDPNGVETTFSYDARNRLLQRNIGARHTVYTYNAAEMLTSEQLPNQAKYTYTYDNAHRLTQVTDRLGAYKTLTLSAAGNPTSVSVYNSTPTLLSTHSYTYNSLNLVATDTGAYTSEETAYAYDNNGNLLSIVDPDSHTTTFSYDALNRRHTSADPLGHTTTYGYNANDDLTSVLDPKSLTTTYTYDGLDNQTAVSSPDTGSTTRTFDSAGNVLTSTDARSDVTTYTYDALQRPLTVSYTSGTGITYTYDAGTNGIGHLTSMTDATGHTAWTYSAYGDKTSKAQTTGSLTLTVTYQQDYISNLLDNLYYPSGKYASYNYDAQARITNINVPGGTGYVVESATYQPFVNQALTWEQVDSSTYTRVMDHDNRITSIADGTLNTQTLTYDLASRLTGLTETGLSNKTYGYDNANRLTSLLNGTATTTYNYDNDDNRSSLVTSAGTVTYNYPTTNNHLTSLSGHIAQTNTYDTAGNQTGDGTNTWTYNARGRMSQDATTGLTTTYGVNGLGQRVTKSNSTLTGGTTEYLYDELGHLLGEYDASGNPIQETFWLYDTPVAVLMGTAHTGYAIASDWQNTPHIITNTSGAKAWTWDRLAFGDNAPNQNPSGLGAFVYNSRLPGQVADSESGTNNNGFRTYSAAVGRYIQSDPIGLLGGVNRYAYTGNSPVLRVDSVGLDWVVTQYEGGKGNPFGHIGLGGTQPNMSTPTIGYYGSPNSSAIQLYDGSPSVWITDLGPPQQTITVQTNALQDVLISGSIQEQIDNPQQYNLTSHNCASAAESALSNGGIGSSNTIFPRTLIGQLQQGQPFTPIPSISPTFTPVPQY